jgi:hypothetical protein
MLGHHDQALYPELKKQKPHKPTATQESNRECNILATIGTEHSGASSYTAPFSEPCEA